MCRSPVQGLQRAEVPVFRWKNVPKASTASEEIPIFAALHQERGAPKIVTMLLGLCQDSEMEIEAKVMRNM